MKLHSKFRWSKATALFVASIAIVVGLGAAMAFATIAPSFVVATDTKVGNEVHLQWNGNTGDTIYYKVQGSSAAFTQWTGAVVEGTEPSMEATLTGDATHELNNGTTYVFEVKNTDSVVADSNGVTPTDATAPTVKPLTIEGTLSGEWYTSVPTYTVTAVDPAGINTYEAQIDATNSPVAISGPIGVGSADGMPKLTAGKHTVYYRATDGYGNVSPWASTEFKVDLDKPNAPVISAVTALPNGEIKVTFGAKDVDPGSGIASYEVFKSTESSGAAATSVGTFDTSATAGVVATATSLTEGTPYYFLVKATDASGQTSSYSATSTPGVKSDATSPTIDVSAGTTGDYPSTWTTPSVAPTITVTDPISGVASINYKIYKVDASGDATLSLSKTTTADTTQVVGVEIPEGRSYMDVTAIDKAGNQQGPVRYYYLTDNATPVSAADPVEFDGANSTYATFPEVPIKATDAAYGARITIKYRWDDNISDTATQSVVGTSSIVTVAPTHEGTRTLTYWAEDAAGNIETPVHAAQYYVDLHQPVVTAKVLPAAAGWTSADTTVSAEATTNGGKAVTKISYKYDTDTDWSSVATDNVAFAAKEGSHTVTFVAEDASGTAGLAQTVSYKLDQTAPVVDATSQVVNSATPTLTIPVADADSGLASGSITTLFTAPEATVVTGALQVKIDAPLVPGNNLIKIVATDKADNSSDPVYLTVNYVIPPVTYTVAYAADANGTISGNAAQTVTSGANGTLVTAIPKAGFHFVKWSDGVLSAARAESNVQANVSVTAQFAADVVPPAPVTYTVAYAADANGTISGNAAQTVTSGANGTLVTAIPNAGFHFVKWSDGVLSAARAESNVQANVSVTAQFAADVVPPAPTTFTITNMLGLNGTATWVGAKTVQSGTNAYISFKANPGYHIADVKIDGVSVGAVDSYFFDNISANHTVGVTFAWTKLPTTATAKLSAKTVLLNHYVTVSGKLTGGTFSGQTFQIQYRRSTTSKYSVFKTLKVNSSGAASYKLKATRRGTYYYRVVFLGDAKFLPAPIKAGIKLVVK